MTATPGSPRRNFLARLLGALAGGWVGGSALTSRAEAATTQGYDAPYLGEIKMFGADWAPLGWRICDGSVLLIADYESLFNLIGTTYGGDGQTTFALPDLRGRAPLHMGSSNPIGQSTGQETVTIVTSQSPFHTHALQAGSGLGASDTPAGQVPAQNGLGAPHYGGSVDTFLASTTLVPVGGSQPHNNMMPSLGINFIICVDFGVYPTP